MAVNLMETVRRQTFAVNRMGQDGSVTLSGASGQALANLSQMRCLPILGPGHVKPMSQRTGNQPDARLVDKPRGLHAGRRACEWASISARERFQAFEPALSASGLSGPHADFLLGRSAWEYCSWTIGVGSVATYAG
jgi:hypothetical protein